MGENANTLELQNSDFEEDRYSRLRLIPWWDQDRPKNATIMVVGAGAIGTFVYKNRAKLEERRINKLRKKGYIITKAEVTDYDDPYSEETED